MANDFSSRVWKIDTAGAGVIWKYNFKAKFIEIIGGVAGTIGNAMATLTDQNGKAIITSLYQTANAGEIQTFNVDDWYNGLIVSALGTGVVVLIHLR